ncbi:MAG: tRNA (adenosine(37)-N6)-dimethylallyltransferase MiaA [Oscillospiraceae bacterium]|jgi:tRNA dimethylallyltransferase|nr:tRNA (adenosine(37)-N6)-dimethylallyltransferase MiaA [Oscillospiraceae bacterium]
MDGRAIVVITGPTATGKTRLSVLLAKRFGGEIVNADSMQVYRGMDIGTSKPTIEERGGVPHHMFDIVEPGDAYSVSRYVEEATKVVTEIQARGNVPFVVGGTMLYIDSLVRGRTFAASDPDVRKAVESLSDPYSELKRVDPDGAANLHPNDRLRVVRALEIVRLTGKTIAQHNAETMSRADAFNSTKIALDFADRNFLYFMIDKRVDSMLKCGLVDEVRRLNVRTNAIGYKEIAAALRGECSMDSAVMSVKQASRNYAKRQITWLRQDLSVNRILRDEEIDMERTLHISTGILEKAGYNAINPDV